ncbi:hypothetical protein [Porphyromonas pogonae]|uniref:hypothetical protein n=1 Tax=Porphyromonas pogonae TaxID=867595 RepID=UPI002E78F02C|nr:hypothetical protein [Porphyromonas pogonae]
MYNKQDSVIKKDVEKCAFDFPRKSGKVKATYRNNEFHIETSCLKSLSINISPEMVNMNKPIKVYIDGKLRYNHKVVFGKEFMRQNFEKNRDRDQVWVNQIRLNM